ncbi:MAG: class I tRNA ligase family protein, partial [bacterium]
NGDIMSKSKGNVTSPIEVTDEHGVDVSRLAMLFFAPPEHEISWSNDALKGAERFLTRVDRFIPENIDSAKNTSSIQGLSERDSELYREINRTVKAVTEDIDNMSYNTAIARMMEFMNFADPDELDKSEIAYYIADRLVRILAPFAPHLAEELNARIGRNELVVQREWPSYDESAIGFDTVEIGVQINGKVRGTVNISPDAVEKTAVEAALSEPAVRKYTDDKNIVKTIYVPGRILNIIVK